MDRQDLIRYWQNSAVKDCQTMNNLFNSQDYHWALFIGHLVIEKLLKAVYVKNIDINPPKTNNLAQLVERCHLATDEDILDKLDQITAFNISARYPDYESSFYEKCTPEFTEINIKIIKEIKQWLIQQL